MATTATSAYPQLRPEGVAAEIGNPNPTGHAPEETVEYKRSALLIRRFHSVLLDLGLDRTLPPNWISPTDGDVVFGALTFSQADVLILALEDLTTRRQSTWPTPGPGQLSFFGGDS
jgi:hypothetical protein